MKTYDVHLRVDTARLATLIEVAQPSAQILSVKPTEETEPREVKKHHYVNGKRNKGISARNLALQTISERFHCTLAQIKTAFKLKGFATSSVSPTLSTLVRENLIIAISPRVFALTPKTKTSPFSAPEVTS